MTCTAASPLGLPHAVATTDCAAPDVRVHVFRLDRADVTARQRAYQSLDTTERTRCQRFVFKQDAVRYACSRHALRQVLATHLDVTPSQLTFATGNHGRPYLVDAPAAVDFNLSHSGDWIAIAVATTALVGIDIETRERFDGTDLADLVLGAAERRQLDRRDAAVPALAEWWCAKEAFVKLNGVGLSLEPHVIELGWTVASQAIATAPASQAIAVPRAFITPVMVDASVACMLATAAIPTLEVSDGVW